MSVKYLYKNTQDCKQFATTFKSDSQQISNTAQMIAIHFEEPNTK
jgi:hypothetical protein